MRVFLTAIFQLFTFISISYCQNETIVLKPIGSGSFDVGLIFIQGMSIPSVNYVKALRELQQKFPDNLWIAIPEFYYDVPDSTKMAEALNLSYSALENSGLKIERTTPFFFVAHGDGSIKLQDFLFNNDTYKHLPINVTGLILNGSFFNRYYRVQVGKNFAPIFTIGAELDGYNRLTRVSESLYFDYFIRSTPSNSYTVVIEGMNHYQFIGDGIPPDYLTFKDIIPEIDNQTATDQLTTLMKSFMKLALCSYYSDCLDERIFIETLVATSLNLVQPILDAFQYEGYYFLQEPCFIIPALNPPNCTQGAEWVGIMQRVFGTLDSVPNITNIDRFKPFNDFIFGIYY
jgi:hypothetical protein